MTEQDHPNRTVVFDGRTFELADLVPSGGLAGTYAVLEDGARIGVVLAHHYPVYRDEAVELVGHLLDDLERRSERTGSAAD